MDWTAFITALLGGGVGGGTLVKLYQLYIKDRKDSNASLSAQINRLEARIATLETRNDRLLVENGELRAGQARLEAQRNALQDRVTALEHELEEVRNGQK